eukprot:5080993-Prymnesium_polylepis.1
MQLVTLHAMQEAGFDAFGWVHPSEEPDGIRLDEATPYPLGAFLYRMKNHADPIFYAMVPIVAAEANRLRQGDGLACPISQGLSSLMARTQQSQQEAREEHVQMEKLTGTHSVGHMPTICHPLALARMLAPVAMGALTFLVQITLAWADYDTYEIGSTLIFYSMLTYVSWRPFFETATGGLPKHDTRLLRLIAFALPAFTVIIFVTFKYPTNIEVADVAAQVVGFSGVWCLLPFMLLYFRKKQAKILLEIHNRGGIDVRISAAGSERKSSLAMSRAKTNYVAQAVNAQFTVDLKNDIDELAKKELDEHATQRYTTRTLDTDSAAAPVVLSDAPATAVPEPGAGTEDE